MRFESAVSYEDAVAKAADECGIQREYWDILHHRHEASVEARRSVLQSLGWNVNSLETIEADRRSAFDQRACSTLPPTVVASSADLFLPVCLPSSLDGTLRFDVSLESGEK